MARRPATPAHVAAAMLYRQFGIAPDRLTADVYARLGFDKGSGFLRG
jgi:hypothetical protein